MFNKVHDCKFVHQINSCCEKTILALSTNIGTSNSHYRETRCVVYGQQHDVNRYRQEKNEIDLIPDDVEEPNLLINMNEKRKGCLK